MLIQCEIADHRDYDPLDGKHNPIGLMTFFINRDVFDIKRNQVIKPFLQSYEYLVIGYDQIYNIVKIIPYCNFSKMVFERQVKK